MTDHRIWCDYKHCSGKGLSETEGEGLRLARLNLKIGKASWRVCESCCEHLLRERRNWPDADAPVHKSLFRQPAPPKPEASPEPTSEARSKKKRVPHANKRPLREQNEEAQELKRERRRKERARQRKKNAGRPTMKEMEAKADAKMAEKKRRKASWLDRKRGD
jgi:hypothetical protein